MKIEPFGKATREQIRAIEQEFDIILPEDYVSFLLENNGGRTVRDNQAEMVYVPDLQEEVDVVTLFGISASKKAEDIRWNMDLPDKLTSHTLLIGDDQFGCFFCLIADGENDGIWFWDSMRTFEQSTDESNTYFISKTFTEFLNGGSNP